MSGSDLCEDPDFPTLEVGNIALSSFLCLPLQNHTSLLASCFNKVDHVALALSALSNLDTEVHPFSLD